MSSPFLDISWADEVFDGMLASRLAVYRKDQTRDSYGNVSNVVYTELTRDIPCLVRNLKGEELNTPPAPQSQTSYGVQEFIIYMRLLQVDSPAVALNIRHFFQILTANQVANGDDYSDPNDPNEKAVLYNITNISNPALMDHHLEVSATVLTP